MFRDIGGSGGSSFNSINDFSPDLPPPCLQALYNVHSHSVKSTKERRKQLGLLLVAGEKIVVIKGRIVKLIVNRNFKEWLKYTKRNINYKEIID